MVRPVGRRHLGLLIAVVVLSGCGTLANPVSDVPHAYPAGCGDFQLSARRCTLIVEELAHRDGFASSDATSIDLLGDPGCGKRHDPCARTTSFVVRVRYHLASGETREESDFCSIEAPYSILCTETPEIRVILPIENGYHDAPCDGPPVRTETPEELQAGQTMPPTCPTPFPSPDPSTAAAEQPLIVPSMDVPIDHIGKYDIELGRGALANGLLEATTTTASVVPQLGFFLRGPMFLELTSLLPGGRPFQNYFEHGRVNGTEPFAAHLTFEVMAFDPGATLRISGVDIR